MSLESTTNLGVADAARKAIAELQGFTQSLVAGATANTAIAVTGMEREDTIVSVLNLTDLTQLSVADFTIADRRASGTQTLTVDVADGDTCQVNGKTYTFVEVADINNIAYNPPPATIPMEVGASGIDIDVVGELFAKVIMSNDPLIEASNEEGVVTVRYRTAGTGGNSIALGVTGANGHIERSGANLTGGTATTSFSGANSTASKKLLVSWYNKQ